MCYPQPANFLVYKKFPKHDSRKRACKYLVRVVCLQDKSGLDLSPPFIQIYQQ
jgi:hypothetical protein